MDTWHPTPPPAALPVRYADRVEVQEDGCWYWTGTVLDNGYGQVSYQGRPWLVHRLVRTLLVGPIPAGLTLDHRCHDRTCVPRGPVCQHRRCCNPAHTEHSTRGKNSARHHREKEKCPAGHMYDRTDRRGWRSCSTCANTRKRKRRAGGELDVRRGGGGGPGQVSRVL